MHPLRDLLYGLKRRMYAGDRPGRLARAMNRLGAWQYAAGLLSPSRAVTLEVVGRRSGHVISFPLVMSTVDGERYLVSMLGENANWVANVRAAGGHAVLRRRTRQDVVLVEVAPALRGPVLRRYLADAPGARPHVPVDRRAPEDELARVAAGIPVFRVTPAG